jgi:peptidoglycan/LPS O-acetylase OafA/YrhL
MSQASIAPAGGRIQSADALRAFFMLSVIFIHAGTLVTTNAALRGSNILATLIVMQGFFLLSGLFAARSLGRTPVREFYRGRLTSLLVPLLVMLPTNLVTLWAIDSYARTRAEAFPHLEVGTLATPWHLHLWFLFVLALFTALAPALQAVALRAARLLERAAVPPLVLALVLIVAMTIGARTALKIAATPWPPLDSIWLVVASAMYVPSYLLGNVAWHHAGLRGVLIAPRSRDAAVWAAIAAAGLALILFGLVEGPLRRITEAATALGVFGLLSFAFRQFVPERSAVVTFVSDAAYTVYLTHLICIWLLWAAVGGWIESYAVLYVLAVVVGLAVPLSLHAFVVQRFALAAFLLNGKRRKQPASPEVPQPQFAR